MVNFGLNPASILGILLAVAGAGLYYLRTIRPELSRDHDIFFAAIGLLCGLILLFQGWRLDPILGFGQFLLAGTAIFFAVESIRMRGVTTKQAKQNTPIVDEDRPVSSNYYADYYAEAELEELEPPYEERPLNRRLKGTPDPRRGGGYDDEPPSRLPRRSSADKMRGDRSSRRGSRPNRRPTEPPQDPWGEDVGSEWDNPRRSNDEWGESSGGVPKKPRRPRPSSPAGAAEDIPEAPPRPRRSRPRPAPESTSDPLRNGEPTPTDYVDYQPIDRPEEGSETDNFDY